MITEHQEICCLQFGSVLGLKKTDKKQNLNKVVELLKFSLSLNDEEIMKSTIESVIEILEEELKKK